MLLLLTLAALAAPPAPPPAADAKDVPVVVDVPRDRVAAAGLLTSERRRLRSTNRRLDSLLAHGVRRSRTFRSLVSAIEDNDVIVYLEVTNRMPAKVSGRLLLQAVTGRHRYVRVQVRSNLPDNHTIATVAHELRHALEVAADASVVDDATLASLFERIGYPSYGAQAYDTDAAKRTGEAVQAELAG